MPRKKGLQVRGDGSGSHATSRGAASAGRNSARTVRKEPGPDVPKGPQGDRKRGKGKGKIQLEKGTAAPDFPADVVARMDSPLQRMLKVVEHVMKLPEAAPFIDPVDANEVPDYYDKVKKARNFGRIEGKLLQGQNHGWALCGYKQLAEVVADVRQIWANCRLYNEDDSQICRMCDACETEFERVYALANLVPIIQEASSLNGPFGGRPGAKRKSSAMGNTSSQAYGPDAAWAEVPPGPEPKRRRQMLLNGPNAGMRVDANGVPLPVPPSGDGAAMGIADQGATRAAWEAGISPVGVGSDSLDLQSIEEDFAEIDRRQNLLNCLKGRVNQLQRQTANANVTEGVRALHDLWGEEGRWEAVVQWVRCSGHERRRDGDAEAPQQTTANGTGDVGSSSDDESDDDEPPPKRLAVRNPSGLPPMRPTMGPSPFVARWVRALQLPQAQMWQPAHMMHPLAPGGAHLGVPHMGLMSRAPQGVAGMHNQGL